MGLVVRYNAQKMIRNDLDREMMFGNGALGDFGESLSLRFYSLRHNTYICESAVLGEGCRGVNIV